MLPLQFWVGWRLFISFQQLYSHIHCTLPYSDWHSFLAWLVVSRLWFCGFPLHSLCFPTSSWEPALSIISCRTNWDSFWRGSGIFCHAHESLAFPNFPIIPQFMESTSNTPMGSRGQPVLLSSGNTSMKLCHKKCGNDCWNFSCILNYSLLCLMWCWMNAMCSGWKESRLKISEWIVQRIVRKG